MNHLMLAAGEGNPVAGFLIIAFIFWLVWLFNRPKGWTVRSHGVTTVTPKK